MGLPNAARLAGGAIAGAALIVAAASVQAEGAPPASAITGVDITGTQAVGRFDGVDYTRTWGVVHGRVNPREAVAGLAALPKASDGDFAYAAEFEVIAPSRGAAPAATVFVEAENRGNPIFLAALNHMPVSGRPSAAAYPAGLGNGFLFNHHIAYARVQWQTGIAAGVPDSAQGVGEVITRDFGRLLAGRGATPAPGLGVYRHRILAAISQSAWFVNTFIAEGFNADPVNARGVYDGAIAIDGTGNWIAINQLAAKNGFAEYPYVNEAARPLAPRALLSRPASDPFYIDVANLTDYYRVRASISREAELPAGMRRYDWPSPHAPGSAGAAKVMFAGGPAACNGGVAAPLDPISYAPYARAIVLGLARRLDGADHAPALPPNTLFTLGPPPADTVHFNPLPGVALHTPARDADGQPVGGVRFPEVEAPIGKPTVNLPHVGLDSIRDACGNLMEWETFSPEDLAHRYGSQAAWLARYRQSLSRLIAAGYLLAEDQPEMLATAAALYRNPAGY